jgi:hypothetical protein
VTTAALGDAAVPDGGTAANGVFVTHDHGATFTRVAALGAGRLFHSVALAPSDPARIYVTSASASVTAPAPTLHVSTDHGATFTAIPLAAQIDGRTPSQLNVLAVDPRTPTRLYARASVSYTDDAGAASLQSLLHSTDGGVTFTELWKMPGVTTSGGIDRGIEGVAFDVARAKVLIATQMGMLAGTDDGAAQNVTVAPTGNLSQAQCVDVHGGDVIACSNNYAPDLAALARSTDGAQTFSSIFTFDQTQGPVDCPASTPVGAMCPLYWLTYGPQLGVTLPDADGGTDGGGPPKPKSGCACALGASVQAGVWGVVLAVLGAALAMRRKVRSSRRDRSPP